jgi:hypothetical protein
MLLWAILYFSFAYLATVVFGGQYDSFRDMTTTSGITQLDMMIGGLEYVPEDFSHDNLLMIYIAAFFLVQFFFMLNFMLSIVVEAYLRVKRAIEEQETEQNFVLDMGAVVRVMFKSKVEKWPPPAQVIETLSKFTSKRTVDLDTLGKVGSDWDRSSRVRFIKHYERYDFLMPKKIEENIQTFDHAVDTLERRFAVVVGQPLPTMHERMSISKKKPPERFDVRFGRMEKKLDFLLESAGATHETREELQRYRSSTYYPSPTSTSVPGEPLNTNVLVVPPPGADYSPLISSLFDT